MDFLATLEPVIHVKIPQFWEKGSENLWGASLNLLHMAKSITCQEKEADLQKFSVQFVLLIAQDGPCRLQQVCGNQCSVL